MSATCGGIRVVSVYVPNGREPDSEHYRYKLAWLASLRDAVAAGPEATIVCGDMNIAPTDEDVFDPEAYVGQTHVTAPERDGAGRARGARPARRGARSLAGRAGVHLLGLPRRACSTRTSACGSTWCSPAHPVAERVKAAWVDRQARKGSGPSDHAPVIVDLDEAPDGDIGPGRAAAVGAGRQARHESSCRSRSSRLVCGRRLSRAGGRDRATAGRAWARPGIFG